MVNVENLLKLKQVRDELARLGWRAPEPPPFKASGDCVSGELLVLDSGLAPSRRSWLEDKWVDGFRESDFHSTGNTHPAY